MKIYKTQQQIEADIKDGVLLVNDDVKFETSFSIDASIKISGNINAVDIKALDINALNIKAVDINVLDINALNIKARNINAWNINARNIEARDINAWSIDAENILYYAVCVAYNSIKCLSIKAKREKHLKPICIEGDLVIKKTANKKLKVKNHK